MKKLILGSVLVLTSIAKANTANLNLVCSSADKKTEVSVNLKFPSSGEISGEATIGDLKLNLVPSQFAPVFEASEGDIDNNQSYLLTLLRQPGSDDVLSYQSAVLIMEEHIDRVGYENSVIQLSCK